jgi:hypothetical protein
MPKCGSSRTAGYLAASASPIRRRPPRSRRRARLRGRLITLYNGLTRDLTTKRDLTTTRSHDHNNRLQL